VARIRNNETAGANIRTIKLEGPGLGTMKLLGTIL